MMLDGKKTTPQYQLQAGEMSLDEYKARYLRELEAEGAVHQDFGVFGPATVEYERALEQADRWQDDGGDKIQEAVDRDFALPKWKHLFAGMDPRAVRQVIWSEYNARREDRAADEAAAVPGTAAFFPVPTAPREAMWRMNRTYTLLCYIRFSFDPAFEPIAGDDDHSVPKRQTAGG